MTKRTVPFLIDHLDSLGQGVSKIADKITFISKVLPGEEGVAEIYAEKSKVAFARPLELSRFSEQRIEPLCPHYQNCSGCHYLHTSYQNELNYKKSALAQQLSKWLPKAEITVHPALSRSGYRNRLQLHYRKKTRELGLIDRADRQLVQIPDCLIGSSAISRALNELYTNWKYLVDDAPEKGHLELYEKSDGTVSIEINAAYAHGGFTQVNPHMNLKLIEIVSKVLDGRERVLDLFGGHGNLTQKLYNSSIMVVDVGEERELFLPNQQFVSIDLYSKNALHKLSKQVRLPVQGMVIDPPRSGLKNLLEYVDHFKPEVLVYVSCFSATMVRDLQNISGYQVSQVELVELFPSTYHFESVIVLKKIID